ncbi:MAG: sortase [Chloroflexota bacterium]
MNPGPTPLAVEANPSAPRRGRWLALGALLLSALALSLFLLGIRSTGLAKASAPSAQDAAPLAAPFDLKITKSNFPATFKVGTGNLYVLSVSRVISDTIDPSVVIGIDDTLPPGVTWTPANSGKWSCVGSSTTTSVSCIYSDQNNPETFDALQVPVVVASTVGATVVNTATLLVSADDMVSTNNISSVTTVVDSVDMGVSLSVVPASTIDAGDTITFTLAITNAGPAAGTNAVVSLPLPADFSYTRLSSSSPGACLTVPATGPSTLTWNIGSLPKSSVPLNCVFTATADLTALNGEYTFKGTATSSNRSDWDTANNSDTVVVTVSPEVDLAITKSDGASTIPAGQNTTYTIRVENTGLLTATQVVVTDNFGPYLSWVSLDDMGNDINTSFPGSNQVILQLNDPIYPGDYVTFRVTARVSSSTPLGASIANTVTAVTGAAESHTSNNTATDTDTALAPVTPLEISKSVSPAYPNPVYVGQQVVFTISVSNITAAIPASFVTVTDDLNDAFDYVSCAFVSSADGYCYYSSSTHTVQAIIYAINPGAFVQFQLTVRLNSTINSPSTITNLATVTSSSPVVNRTSNSVQINALPGADLQAGKTNGITSVVADSVVTYTISLTNTGSLDAVGVVILDTLDPNMSLVRVKRTGLESSTLITTTQTVQLNLAGGLAPGAVISFKVAAELDSGVAIGSSVVNTVHADTLTPEGWTANNTAYDTDTVAAVAEVTISMVAAPTSLKVGEDIGFRIQIHNNSSVDATNLTLTDPLPSVLDSIANTTEASRGTVSISSDTVTWTLDKLASGKMATLETAAKVNTSAVAKTSYVNKARLTYKDGSGDTQTVDASAKFRVLPGGVLPGTGWGPPASLGARPAGNIFMLWLAPGLLALFILLLGSQLLRRRAVHAGRWLLVLAALVGLFGCGQLGPATSGAPPPTQELLSRPGKPVVQEVTPTATLAQAPLDGAPGPVVWVFPEPTPTPEALPDYAVPTPEAQPTPSRDGLLPDASAITRIVIPAINVDTVVKFVPYSGDTWLIGGLRMEVAWMGETSWPGMGSNTGLAGHVDLVDGSPGPFWRLRELKAGDQVVLYTEVNLYTYRVRASKVVEDWDLSVIDETAEPQITLITCTEWDAQLYTYLKRLVVFADLLDVKAL